MDLTPVERPFDRCHTNCGETPDWGELAHLLPADLLELQADSDRSEPIKRLVLKVEQAVAAARMTATRKGARL